MRESLTILAVLVILVLTAALVGPYFVDWSAQRGLVEAKLSEALGTPLKIRGNIDLKLLPTPVLTLGDLSAGSGSEPTFSAEAARVELSIAGLLRGELDFTNAVFDRPTLRLSSAAALSPPAGILTRHRIQLDRIAVRHGSLRIDDEESGNRFSLDDVAFDGEAGSLAGPFKGAGRLRLFGKPIAFRISTGAIASERMRLKLLVDAADAVPETELDGDLVLSRSAGGAPTPFGLGYEGHAAFSGSFGFADADLPPLPWRISGDLKADRNRAVFEKFELHAGKDEQPANATGSGEIAFGPAPSARLILNAKQIDLDRLLGAPAGRIAPLDASAILRTALGGSSPQMPAMPATVEFSIGLVTVGGDALTDIGGALDLAPDQPIKARVAASGPGHSRLSADGTLETGAAAEFKGRVSLSTRDSARTSGWLLQGHEKLAAALSAFLPFKVIDVAGDTEISSVAFAGRNLTATLDRSSLAGAVVFTRAVGRERARLYVEAASDALDLDALPDYGLPGLVAAGDLDLAVHIAARAIKIANLGDAAVDAGRIDLKLTKTGDDTRLDDLTITDLGGASVQASASFGEQGTDFSAKLDADKLGDVAQLARRLLPGPIADSVAGRAAALSPAKLRFELKAGPNGAVDQVALDGTAGGTKISASAGHDKNDPSLIAASADLDGRDTSQLLEQLGLAGTPVAGLGPGRVALSAKGRIDAQFDATAKATLAGCDVSWQGRIDPGTGAVDGPLAIKTANAVPLLSAFGLVLPDPTPALEAQLSAKLSMTGDRLTLGGIAGRFAGTTVSGEIALQRDLGLALSGDPAAAGIPSGRPRLDGRLTMDRLAGSSLAALGLGAQRLGPGGQGLSQAKFLPGLSSPADLDLALRIGALDLGNGTIARDASLRLGLKPGVLSMAEASAELREGRIEGNLTLRRDGAIAAVTGRLAFRDLAFDKPFFAGKANATLDFVGTGDSEATLVGGLAGQGRLSLADARLPGLDADALNRVIGAADAEKLPLDSTAVTRALESETARGARSIQRLDLPASMAGGVVRLGPVALPDPRADISTSASMDLKSLTIAMTTDLRLATAPAHWSGTPPQVTISWDGPLSAARREIDASSFFNGLSARALALNLERIEAVDADIRERAFFNRRLKAIEANEERERQESTAEIGTAQKRNGDEPSSPETRAAQASPPLPPPRPGPETAGENQRRRPAARSSPAQAAPAGHP